MNKLLKLLIFIIIKLEIELYIICFIFKKKYTKYYLFPNSDIKDNGKDYKKE